MLEFYSKLTLPHARYRQPTAEQDGGLGEPSPLAPYLAPAPALTLTLTLTLTLALALALGIAPYLAPAPALTLALARPALAPSPRAAWREAVSSRRQRAHHSCYNTNTALY